MNGVNRGGCIRAEEPAWRVRNASRMNWYGLTHTWNIKGFRLNGVLRGGCSLGSFSNAFFNRIVYKRVTAMDYVYNALGFRFV